MADQDRIRTLWVLRHAQAEPTRAGRTDHDRRLTESGRRAAKQVGERLRNTDGPTDGQPDPGRAIDQVLCSTAVRTRETFQSLGLDLDPSRVDYSDEVYDAGSDTLLALARLFPEDCWAALLVGHAPGTPQLVYDLMSPESDPTAASAVGTRFGTATLARLEFGGDWSGLSSARLVQAQFTP